MANLSNRLCNPTPFKVVWPWHSGITIPIEADGFADLDVNIMDDFRPDKPGYEAVKNQMDQYGIFLRDPTVPYERQAVDSLRACAKTLQSQYSDAINNLRRKAAANGISDEKAILETMKQQGYEKLRERMETITTRIKRYESHLKETVSENLYQKFDPEKTLIFLDPPKVFDSKVAMEVFLEENPRLKKQHNDWLKAQGLAPSRAKKDEVVVEEREAESEQA